MKKRARPLIIDVDSVWRTTTILLSLVKMKSFAQNLFISREPNVLGRETENESLKKRRELILNNYSKEDLRMRYFKLYKKGDGQWNEAWLAKILFPRIMFTNARSLKKTGALVDLPADLITCEIDECLKSETRFNAQTRSESIDIPSYTLQRVNRYPTNSAKSIGGGVACYSKSTMDVTKLEIVGSDDFELMWLLTKALNLYLLVV